MPEYQVHKVTPGQRNPDSWDTFEVVREYKGWLSGFFANQQCASLNRLIALMDSWPRFQAHPSDYYYAIWDVKERRYVK